MSKIRVEYYITDNPDKDYLVKRYDNGCYYINQIVCGKVFYRSWTRVTKNFVEDIIRKDFKGRRLQPLQSIEYNPQVRRFRFEKRK